MPIPTQEITGRIVNERKVKKKPGPYTYARVSNIFWTSYVVVSFLSKIPPITCLEQLPLAHPIHTSYLAESTFYMFGYSNEISVL